VSTGDNWFTEGVKARDEAKELNEIATPKGLLVTFESAGDPEGAMAGHKFWVRREGAPSQHRAAVRKRPKKSGSIWRNSPHKAGA